MNRTNLELPDGRLVTLQGSDEGVAEVVAENYLGQAPLAKGVTNAEEPLTVPGLMIEASGASGRQQGPSIVSNEEEPLEIPRSL